MSTLDFQVRYDGGALEHFASLEAALNFRDGDWDKVSWSVGEFGRMILRHSGTWEWLTPQSILKEIHHAD